MDLEQQDDMRLQRSVEAGLAEAQARVLPKSSDSSDTASTSTMDAAVDSNSDADSAQSGSRESSPNVSNGHKSHDGVTGDSDSSPERPKGSQLSGPEKQQSAVNSVS